MQIKSCFSSLCSWTLALVLCLSPAPCFAFSSEYLAPKHRNIDPYALASYFPKELVAAAIKALTEMEAHGVSAEELEHWTWVVSQKPQLIRRIGFMPFANFAIRHRRLGILALAVACLKDNEIQTPTDLVRLALTAKRVQEEDPGFSQAVWDPFQRRVLYAPGSRAQSLYRDALQRREAIGIDSATGNALKMIGLNHPFFGNRWDDAMKEEFAALKETLLGNRTQREVFGITPENVEEELLERIALFQKTYPKFRFLMQKLKIKGMTPEIFWSVHIPMAYWIFKRKLAQRPTQTHVVEFYTGANAGDTALIQVLALVLGELLRGRKEDVMALAAADTGKTKPQQINEKTGVLLFESGTGAHADVDIQKVDDLVALYADGAAPVPKPEDTSILIRTGEKGSILSLNAGGRLGTIAPEAPKFGRRLVVASGLGVMIGAAVTKWFGPDAWDWLQSWWYGRTRQAIPTADVHVIYGSHSSLIGDKKLWKKQIEVLDRVLQNAPRDKEGRPNAVFLLEMRVNDEIILATARKQYPSLASLSDEQILTDERFLPALEKVYREVLPEEQKHVIEAFNKADPDPDHATDYASHVMANVKSRDLKFTTEVVPFGAWLASARAKLSLDPLVQAKDFSAFCKGMAEKFNLVNHAAEMRDNQLASTFEQLQSPGKFPGALFVTFRGNAHAPFDKAYAQRKYRYASHQTEDVPDPTQWIAAQLRSGKPIREEEFRKTVARYLVRDAVRRHFSSRMQETRRPYRLTEQALAILEKRYPDIESWIENHYLASNSRDEIAQRIVEDFYTMGILRPDPLQPGIPILVGGAISAQPPLDRAKALARFKVILKEHQKVYGGHSWGQPKKQVLEEIVAAARDLFGIPSLTIRVDMRNKALIFEGDKSAGRYDAIFITPWAAEPAKDLQVLGGSALSGPVHEENTPDPYFIRKYVLAPAAPTEVSAPAPEARLPAQKAPLSAEESQAVEFLRQYQDIFTPLLRNSRLVRESDDKVCEELFQGLVGRTLDLEGENIALEETLVRGLQQIVSGDVKEIQDRTGFVKGEWKTFLWALYVWSHMDFDEGQEAAEQINIPPGLDAYRRHVTASMMVYLPVILRERKLSLDAAPNFRAILIPKDDPITPVPENHAGYRVFFYPKNPDWVRQPSVDTVISWEWAASGRVTMDISGQILRTLSKGIRDAEELSKQLARKWEIARNSQRFDVDSRVDAVEFLGERIPARMLKDLVDLIFQDPSPAVRRKLLVVITYMVQEEKQPTQEMMEQFLRLKDYAAQERDPELRKDLAKLLRLNQHKNALQMLLILVQDPDPLVRIAALNSLLLAFTNEDETIQAFARMVHQDPEPEVRAAARRDLDRLASNDKVSIEDPVRLFTGLLNDPDEGIQIEGVNQLRRLPSEKAVDVLVTVLDPEANHPARVKEAAADALAAILQSPQVTPRAFSAWTKENLGDTSKVLLDALISGGDEPWIAPLARVVGLVAGPGAITSMEFALQHDLQLTPANRQALEEAIAQIHARRQRAEEFILLLDRLKGRGTQYISDDDVQALLAAAQDVDPDLLERMVGVSLRNLVKRLSSSDEIAKSSETRRQSLDNLGSLVQLLFPVPKSADFPHAYYDSHRLRRLERALEARGVSQETIARIVQFFLEDVKGTAYYEEGQIFSDEFLVNLDQRLAALTGEPQKSFMQTVREVHCHELVHEYLETPQGLALIQTGVIERTSGRYPMPHAYMRFELLRMLMVESFPDLAKADDQTVAQEAVAKLMSLLFEGPASTSVINPGLRSELTGLHDHLRNHPAFQSMTGSIEAQGEESNQKQVLRTLKGTLHRQGRVTVRVDPGRIAALKSKIEFLLDQANLQSAEFFQRIKRTNEPLSVEQAVELLKRMELTKMHGSPAEDHKRLGLINEVTNRIQVAPEWLEKLEYVYRVHKVRQAHMDPNAPDYPARLLKHFVDGKVMEAQTGRLPAPHDIPIAFAEIEAAPTKDELANRTRQAVEHWLSQGQTLQAILAVRDALRLGLRISDARALEARFQGFRPMGFDPREILSGLIEEAA